MTSPRRNAAASPPIERAESGLGSLVWLVLLWLMFLVMSARADDVRAPPLTGDVESIHEAGRLVFPPT